MQMHLRLGSTLYNGNVFQDSKVMMQMLKPAQINSGQHQVQQCQQYHQNHHQIFAKSAWTKKLILWSILLIQFGFILCFWLLQLGLSGKVDETAGANRELEDNRINFIHSETLKSTNKNKKINKENRTVLNFQWPSRDLKFQDEFFLHQNANNVTETENIMFGGPTLWCFKEGTTNENHNKIDEWNDSNSLFDHCKCLPEWHGRDCGQPEVIWRALLTAKIPFKIKDPTKDEAHRLVYMLEGTFLNLDLIELQIKSVSKVVDYFVVHLKWLYTSAKQVKSLKVRLKQILPKKNYFLYYCKLPSYSNCSSAEAYRLFRQQQLLTNAIKPSDIFILTDDKTILGHRALNFFKFYGSNITPVIRFRLKFNVYGFYWQHPKKTHLSGLISSFQNIDNTDANPNQLLTQITTQQTQSALVIGDLNHFGGWFCKYCQEPDEIITDLQLSSSSLEPPFTKVILTSSPQKSISNTVLFPFNKRHSSHIDVAYIQQLISTGFYLEDGQTQLQKVRRYTDKYYAPQYASEQSWKYSYLLINVYESLEDILGNDNEEVF